MKQRTFLSPSGPRHRLHPRLLIESSDPAMAMADFWLFEEAGFDVALCTGPGAGEECPLVCGGDCRLAQEADVVLMAPGMRGRAAIAAAHHRRRPDLPVVVQVPRGDPGECPPGCIADYYPASVDGQIRAVWRALDTTPSSRPPVPVTAPVPTGPDSTLAHLVHLLGW